MFWATILVQPWHKLPPPSGGAAVCPEQPQLWRPLPRAQSGKGSDDPDIKSAGYLAYLCTWPDIPSLNAITKKTLERKWGKENTVPEVTAKIYCKSRNLPIRIRKITLQIFGNFWVTQYVVYMYKFPLDPTNWVIRSNTIFDIRPDKWQWKCRYPGKPEIRFIRLVETELASLAGVEDLSGPGRGGTGRPSWRLGGRGQPAGVPGGGGQHWCQGGAL